MFKVQTESFKTMVAKSARGASCNKSVALTSLLGIELQDGVLCLSTTDTENTLEVYKEGVEGKDMQCVIGVELFSKLISKQTCAEISVDLKTDKKNESSYVEVKGNGTYKIPVITDDEGPVSFPSIQFDRDGAKEETVLLSSMQNIAEVNRPSLGDNPDNPEISAYCIHVKDDVLQDAVVTTNYSAICVNSFKAFSQDTFLTPSMLDLLLLNTEEKIKCFRGANGDLLFETDDIVIYGPQHDLLEDFPLEGIAAKMAQEYPSRCSIAKVSLQNVLDRLALFIEAYDKNGAYFNFTKSGLQINSKADSSTETLKYAKSEKQRNIQVLVDIPLLKAEVDSLPGEFVEIGYGLEDSISLFSDKVHKMVALHSEETADEEDMDYPGNDEQEELEDAVSNEEQF